MMGGGRNLPIPLVLVLLAWVAVGVLDLTEGQDPWIPNQLHTLACSGLISVTVIASRRPSRNIPATVQAEMDPALMERMVEKAVQVGRDLERRDQGSVTPLQRNPRKEQP